MAGDVIPPDILRVFDSLIRAPHDLELFHQLVLSAIRRLKRNEHALAVLDAQSAFESLVARLTVENLRARGLQPNEVEHEMAFGGSVHTLQQRLRELDRIAGVQPRPGESARKFLGTSEETTWRSSLYALRNRIVHEGVRDVSFEEAKAALVAGLHAIHCVQDLALPFNGAMIWSGAALDLGGLQRSAGRLSRLFES